MRKECDCGQVYTSVPDNARIMDSGSLLDGAYWECQCGSTLFQPSDKARALLREARLARAQKAGLDAVYQALEKK